MAPKNHGMLPLQSRLDTYGKAIQRGRDRQLPAHERAKALWEAAQIARYESMKLLGTEIEPDWRILEEGNYEIEAVSSVRSGRARFEDGRPSLPAKIVQANRDERARLRRYASPERRFHYRYTAADLAWEAAKLMPNQSEDAARALCTAGSWLKTRDLNAADRFYKRLVRRCGRTALGRQADQLRWFPATCGP